MESESTGMHGVLDEDVRKLDDLETWADCLFSSTDEFTLEQYKSHLMMLAEILPTALEELRSAILKDDILRPLQPLNVLHELRRSRNVGRFIRGACVAAETDEGDPHSTLPSELLADVPADDRELVERFIVHSGLSKYVTQIFAVADGSDNIEWYSHRLTLFVRVMLLALEDSIPRCLFDAVVRDKKLRPLRAIEDLKILRRHGDRVKFLLRACVQDPEPRLQSLRVSLAAVTLHYSFMQELKGDVVNTFLRVLDNYDELYRKDKHSGRIVPIIQSSGLGKSRLMNELRKEVPSLTLCCRENDDPSTGWPPRDRDIQEFLTKPRNIVAEIVAAAFLGSLFTEVLEVMQSVKSNDPAELLRCFDHPDPMDPGDLGRVAALRRIAQRAERLLDASASQVPIMPSMPQPQKPEDFASRLRWYEDVFEIFCATPWRDLRQELQRRGHSRIVFGFDECRLLNVSEFSGTIKPDLTTMSLIALHHMIKAADGFYSAEVQNDVKVWYTFLDTNPSVLGLFPSKEQEHAGVPFHRLDGGSEYMHPFSLLGWNLMAPERPSMSPMDALSLERLQLYGRPLWSTESPMLVLRFASLKLFAGSFNPLDKNDLLAAFSHRVALNLGDNVEATHLAIEGVRIHQRVLLSVSKHGYMETATPSEPCLSLAAMGALNQSATVYDNAIIVLTDLILSPPFISKRGANRGLFGALLFTIARDMECIKESQGWYTLAGREAQAVTRLDGRHFATAIRLSDFLASLHGTNDDPTYKDILEVAAKKWINFTHWVRLSSELSSVKPEFLRMAWERGWAFQCVYGQFLFDRLVVTYSGDLDVPWDNSKFGWLVVQDRLRTKATALDLIDGLVGPHINGKRPKDEIVMLLEYGINTSFQLDSPQGTGVSARYGFSPVTKMRKPAANGGTSSYRWPGYVEKEPSRWSIHIRGHSPQEYPVLAPLRSLADILEQELLAVPPDVLQHETDNFKSQLGPPHSLSDVYYVSA